MNKKGFTIIELLMILAIIGILSAIAIHKFLDLSKGSKIQYDSDGKLQPRESLKEIVMDGKVYTLVPKGE